MSASRIWKFMIFLYEWDKNEFTLLILNISRDLLAYDACYSCLLNSTMERDIKTVCVYIWYGIQHGW